MALAYDAATLKPILHEMHKVCIGLKIEITNQKKKSISNLVNFALICQSLIQFH